MKESLYDYDDPNIPEEFYDSEEWMDYLETIRTSEIPDQFMPYVSIKSYDDNWEKLKSERLLPPLEIKDVAKIANCRFTIWHDSDDISARYDVAYTSGKRILDRQLNGTWDKADPRKETENRALDAVRTMVIRSDDHARVRFTRLYEPREVKQQVREINLIELNDGEPFAAWFIVNDYVYPARLDKMFEDKYQWCFNGKNKIHITKFCDWCWEAVK